MGSVGVREQEPYAAKPAGRRADLQDLPNRLPARTAAQGFCTLCPAAALLACSLAGQRLTRQPVNS